jgi:hypothetical protein
VPALVLAGRHRQSSDLRATLVVVTVAVHLRSAGVPWPAGYASLQRSGAAQDCNHQPQWSPRSVLESTYLDCPYCGERIELVIDTSGADTDYVEDCEVCCRPIVVSLAISGDDFVVTVRTENE